MDIAASTKPAGAVNGGPRILLRLEGLTLLAGMMLIYGISGASWWMFAILLLAPDLSLAGYLAGPKAGAVIYNAAHSYIAPGVLVAAGFALGQPLALSIAIIWLAHIGMDRAVGYGLKYGAGFGFTHLGLIGREARAS
jgi:uncharacterized protein DUF4260